MRQKYFSKRLLPAVTIHDPKLALQLAETFLESGLDVMEVTFRTNAAASAISGITKTYPEMKIGAGTITSPDLLKQAVDAGAMFGLAPGFNETIVKTARDHRFPFIPGVTTPSEIERALEFDCSLLKLFPVNNLGGAGYLKSLAGPYPKDKVGFIPMGGVNLTNLNQYLKFPGIIAMGGSWMTPNDMIENRQFHKISEIVRLSLDIVRQVEDHPE
ncbi:MAG: bifunctional 4-hydroxy-2-oxoglutarate aldolase/2-dehydro-3-deoxy-phosphogluconate aldolase [Balneolales bacterium]